MSLQKSVHVLIAAKFFLVCKVSKVCQCIERVQYHFWSFLENVEVRKETGNMAKFWQKWNPSVTNQTWYNSNSNSRFHSTFHVQFHINRSCSFSASISRSLWKENTTDHCTSTWKAISIFPKKSKKLKLNLQNSLFLKLNSCCVLDWSLAVLSFCSCGLYQVEVELRPDPFLHSSVQIAQMYWPGSLSFWFHCLFWYYEL